MQIQYLIDAILKGVLLGLFMAISVGPTLFAIIKYSINLSYKAGIAFILGVSVSDILYVTIANAAAVWLEVLSGYNRYIAFGGGIVLLIAGIGALIRKETPNKKPEEPVIITNAHYVKIWMSGFLINTINPGVIFWWLSAVTATAGTYLSYRIVLFGTCLGLILSIDLLKVFLAEKIRRKLTAARIKLLHNISAIIILLIGAILLVTTAFNIQFKKEDKEKPIHIVK